MLAAMQRMTLYAYIVAGVTIALVSAAQWALLWWQGRRER